MVEMEKGKIVRVDKQAKEQMQTIGRCNHCDQMAKIIFSKYGHLNQCQFSKQHKNYQSRLQDLPNT